MIVTAVAARMEEIAPHYEPLAIEFTRVTNTYTDDQLELILGLFDRMHEASSRVIARLRGASIGAVDEMTTR